MTAFRDNRKILTERQYYLDALERAETGPEATGYGHPINQKMRFDTLIQHVLDPHEGYHTYSLLDVGCGTGDLVPYLASERLMPYSYLGVDCMPEMVERANLTVRHRLEKEMGLGHAPEVMDFRVGTVDDVADWYLDDPPPGFDYVVSIAAYAIKEPHESMQDSLIRVQEDIRHMVNLANKAVAVTLFSTYKTEIMPKEMVVDAAAMFTWAKTRYERVELLHGYCPFDYMLVIRNDESDWRQTWNASQRTLAATA